jgi:hypothetical protein
MSTALGVAIPGLGLEDKQIEHFVKHGFAGFPFSCGHRQEGKRLLKASL